MRQDGEPVAADRTWEGDPVYFRVLIGNTDADIDETIADVIGEAIEQETEGRDLEFVCCPSLRDVESLARRQPVDLFVVVLNNLLDCGVGTVLRRLQELKAAHRKPIVAWPPPTPSSGSPSRPRSCGLPWGQSPLGLRGP